MAFKKGELVKLNLLERNGEGFLGVLDGRFLSSHLGTVRVEDIVGKGEGIIVKAKNRKKFVCVRPTYLEALQKFSRGPAVINLKDAALICGYANIFCGAKVFEAGGGCGFLTYYLSLVVGERGGVVSFESDKNFFKILKKNLKLVGAKNVKAYNLDARNKIPKKYFDAIILDLPNPWDVKFFGSLKTGGYLVTYLPNVAQVSRMERFVRNKFKGKLVHERTVEVIERAWEVDKERSRPRHQILGHTAFLCYYRKLST